MRGTFVDICPGGSVKFHTTLLVGPPRGCGIEGGGKSSLGLTRGSLHRVSAAGEAAVVKSLLDKPENKNGYGTVEPP